MDTDQKRGEVVLYQDANGGVRVDVRLERETLWLTQKQTDRTASRVAPNSARAEGVIDVTSCRRRLLHRPGPHALTPGAWRAREAPTRSPPFDRAPAESNGANRRSPRRIR